MNNNNQQLEYFAVQTLALLAFTKDWNADLFQQITDMAEGQELFIEEKSEIRKLCAAYELNPADYGDEAPSVMKFGDQKLTVEQMSRIEEAYNDVHDAHVEDNTEHILTNQERLIELLASAAGIVVK